MGDNLPTWRWISNLALAGLVAVAFIDNTHDAAALAVGASIGYIFAYDALRGVR